MQVINEKSHYSTVISSLDKQYLNLKKNSNLTPDDIYLLDIIFNLLNGCCVELDEYDTKELLDIYKKLLYNSDSICNNNYQDKYQISKRNKTIQAEIDDCNTTPISKPAMYAWQETLLTNTQQDILNEITSFDYFNNKLKINIDSVENGKVFNYTSVGRVSFYFSNSTSLNYEIRDYDNVVITDGFNIALDEKLGGTLITSKNIISFGDIEFKIKKL